MFKCITLSYVNVGIVNGSILINSRKIKDALIEIKKWSGSGATNT